MPKYDSGKPQFSLIDPKFMLEFAQVMTMGAEKYGADNWKTIENAIPRYKDALHRHMNAFEQGKMDDEESGLSHLAHVAANAMFLHWLAHNPQNDSAKSVEMGCKNCVYNALSNNLVTNSKCVACTYYKNNGKGRMCKTCNYGDNYVKAPRFHGLRVYHPVYCTIEGEYENAEAVCPESPSNMVDPVSCKYGCPGCPANDEEEPRDQGKSERSIIILDLG